MYDFNNRKILDEYFVYHGSKEEREFFDAAIISNRSRFNDNAHLPVIPVQTVDGWDFIENLNDINIGKEINQILDDDNRQVIIINTNKNSSLDISSKNQKVIEIGSNSTSYINPINLPIYYPNNGSEKDEGMCLKCDTMIYICAMAQGGFENLSPVQRAIIDRCCILMYRNLVFNSNIKKELTIEDFYTVLMSQTEKEAVELAKSLEIFITGKLKNYSQKTNIQTDKLTVFNINEEDPELQEIHLVLLFDYIWHNIVGKNYGSGTYTYLYVDDIHILNSYLAFMKVREICKRGIINGLVTTLL